MAKFTDSGMIHKAQAHARIIAWTVMLTGALAILGWLFRVEMLKSIVSGLSVMQPNTALSLVLLGFSLWLLNPEKESEKDWRYHLGVAAAVLPLLIAAGTIVEYACHLSLHIDQFLFRDLRANIPFPGRISPQTATCIVLSSTALLLLRKQSSVAHWLVSASAIVSFTGLLGYAYSITVFYKIQSFTGMALHTAIALTLLNAGLIFASPKVGFWAVWFEKSPGSIMLRRALPGALAGAFVLGWVRLVGQRLGLLSVEVGVVLLVTSSCLVFVLALAWAAKAVNRAAEMVGETFRSAIEAAPNGMLLMDGSGRIVLINTQVERQFGYSREELVGAPIEMLLPKRFRDRHPQFRAGFFSDPKARPMGAGRDLFGLRKDGTEVPIEIGLSPVESSEGKFVLSSIVDITERRCAEASLRESEDRFRMMVSAVQDYAIFMLDPEGHVMNWNAGAARLKGYDESEIVGKHFSCFYSAEQVERGEPQKELSSATKAGRFEDEGWRLRKSGDRFWANVVITPIRKADHTLIGFTKVTRDLTERRRAEEQFRLAIEAAPNGIIIADSSGDMVLVNRQVEKMFGYSREELIGRPVEVLVPQRFKHKHPGFRTDFGHSPQARPMGAGRDLYGLHKDGTEIPIEIGLNPLDTQLGKFILSSIVDVTERKRAEMERADFIKKLQTFNAELEEHVRARTVELSNSLKEREILLQEVHHRVKNNLQVISSLINLQGRRVSDKSSREALEDCGARVSAIALIHEKLYQSNDYANVPFADYTRRVVENAFRISNWESNRVSMDLSAIHDVSLPVDKAVPCGLILNELITNAVKHAFPGTREGTIHVGLHALDGGRLVLSVKDNGVGVSQDLDPDRTTSLGLNLIRTLAAQLKAELSMTTGPQQGTCFTLTFEGVDSRISECAGMATSYS